MVIHKLTNTHTYTPGGVSHLLVRSHQQETTESAWFYEYYIVLTHTHTHTHSQSRLHIHISDRKVKDLEKNV